MKGTIVINDEQGKNYYETSRRRVQQLLRMNKGRKTIVRDEKEK